MIYDHTEWRRSDPVFFDTEEGKFYFWDEVWANKEGPYDSYKQTLDALANYCEHILGDSPKEIMNG